MDSQNNIKKTNDRTSLLFVLYLTINAPDFQLIPLDRNTYKKQKVRNKTDVELVTLIYELADS